MQYYGHLDQIYGIRMRDTCKIKKVKKDVIEDGIFKGFYWGFIKCAFVPDAPIYDLKNKDVTQYDIVYDDKYMRVHCTTKNGQFSLHPPKIVREFIISIGTKPAVFDDLIRIVLAYLKECVRTYTPNNCVAINNKVYQC